MFTWRTMTHQYKSISWLLAAAILLLTVLPAHLHLHHVDTAANQSHEYVIDWHFIADDIATDHHENVTLLPAAPDGLIKKLGDHPLLATVLILLIVFVLPTAIRTLQLRLSNHHHVPASFYTIAPPLRAPPLH